MHLLFNYIWHCNNYNYAFGEKNQCHCKGRHFQWGKCSASSFKEEGRGREVEALPSRPSVILYLPRSRKLFFSWVIWELFCSRGKIFSGYWVKINMYQGNIYFPHGRRFLPLEKFPPSGNRISLGQVPSTLASLTEMEISMYLHKFLPSPDSSVGKVPGYRAKVPRFKSCVLLIVITNDFIIFEFSLLKLKFQEIDLKFCLAPIAQLIECQTLD